MQEENQEGATPEEQQDLSLGMSDEEFLNSDWDAPTEPEALEAEGEKAPADPEADPNGDEPSDGEPEGAQPGADPQEEEESAEGGEEESTETEEDADPDTDESEDEQDYGKLYAELMAPFKANGRTMQAKTPEEARQLMMMGANYNKKMVGLKPHLKTLKVLEQNELLDEDKLSFLIDLNQGKPEAIAKLLKDSNIDPIDLDLDASQSYKPTERKVSDEELAFDEVVERNSDSPTFPKVLDTVGNKWDQSSRQVVAQHPQLLEVINDHMANGVYDVISTEVERQRMLGQLQGMSDLEAYRQVGDTLHANGSFDHLGKQDDQGQQSKPAAKRASQQRSKPDDKALAERRRAASATRAAPTSKAKQDFNPLALPDDEFEKLVL